MSQSYESIRDGTHPHSAAINGDVNSSFEDEESPLLGHQSPNIQSNVPTHTIPDPSGNDVEVELIDGHDGTRSQHSVITIFSMWNTMMGTSLLSMPWAIKQAGFVNGIVLLVVMAGIMAYTSYRVLAAGRLIAGSILSEFSDVVKVYLGRAAEILTLLCSMLTLLGGCIVYWILMSNFLYHIGVFIYSHTHSSSPPHVNDSSTLYSDFLASDVVCNNQTDATGYEDKTFLRVWSETETVPFYLVAMLFPLLNFKSPTFFTKFNALGTLSVTYLAVFVAVKADLWGINIDLGPDLTSAITHSSKFEWSFPALTGVAALAYFLQNCVIAIVRNQKHPENNTRDLIIAYICVCVTYTYMGAIFYATFPLSKQCIEDNFLNNIASTDIMAFVARIGLFFQMMCVLPLLTFVIRAQLLQFVFHSVWPSIRHVLILNVLIIGVCLVFAVFLPSIGHIISFVGAFCGFSYAIALPCLVYLVSCHRQGTLTTWKLVIHGLLILIGLANFVAQFVIIGHTQ